MSPDEQKALQQLEVDLGPLKEEVHQSKARLHDLKESVLRGKITGSKVFIRFDNEAEGFFALTSAEFFVDDELVKKLTVKEGDRAPRTLTVFDSDTPSGEHSLRVRIKYRGSDRSIYRAFAYFKDHLFSVEASEKFPVEYGKTTLVKLVALDKGYFKTKLDERLFLEMRVSRDWGTETAEP